MRPVHYYIFCEPLVALKVRQDIDEQIVLTCSLSYSGENSGKWQKRARQTRVAATPGPGVRQTTQAGGGNSARRENPGSRGRLDAARGARAERAPEQKRERKRDGEREKSGSDMTSRSQAPPRSALRFKIQAKGAGSKPPWTRCAIRWRLLN